MSSNRQGESAIRRSLKVMRVAITINVRFTAACADEWLPFEHYAGRRQFYPFRRSQSARRLLQNVPSVLCSFSLSLHPRAEYHLQGLCIHRCKGTLWISFNSLNNVWSVSVCVMDLFDLRVILLACLANRSRLTSHSSYRLGRYKTFTFFEGPFLLLLISYTTFPAFPSQNDRPLLARSS